MSLYVEIEKRTLREAIERAEADASSCVVAVYREHPDAAQARQAAAERQALWRSREAIAAQMGQPVRQGLRMVGGQYGR